jgi:hypothetical protein
MDCADTAAVTMIDVPPRVPVDLASPISCLASMGLLDSVADASAGDGDAGLVAIADALDSAFVADMWARVLGGVSVGLLTDGLVIRADGSVEGPDRPDAVLRCARVTFCRVADLRDGGRCLFAVAMDAAARVADVCVYDPSGGPRDEGRLRAMAAAVGDWMRTSSALGEGWGLRMEVVCRATMPPPGGRFWLMLMLLIKPYMPHARMVDTQAALRFECLARRIDMGALLALVLRNVVARCPKKISG